MAKTANASGSKTIRVTLATQSVLVLEELAKQGVRGKNAAEVAARLIERALEPFVEPPKIKLPSHRPSANKRAR